mgnify:FL=1
MIYFLIFFIGTTIGAIIGFMFAAVLAAGGHSDDVQEAYHQGFVKGKDSVLKDVKDVNDLYNKYKDLADGHNDTRC